MESATGIWLPKIIGSGFQPSGFQAGHESARVSFGPKPASHQLYGVEGVAILASGGGGASSAADSYAIA